MRPGRALTVTIVGLGRAHGRPSEDTNTASKTTHPVQLFRTYSVAFRPKGVDSPPSNAMQLEATGVGIGAGEGEGEGGGVGVGCLSP